MQLENETFDYKFDEGKILFEVRQYIDGTYNSHYAQSHKQATEIIIDLDRNIDETQNFMDNL